MRTVDDFVTLRVRGIDARVRWIGRFEESPEESPAAPRPVLLLLHGHSSSVGEFEQLIPPLSKLADVFSFDHPHCGKSHPVSFSAIEQAYSAPDTRHYEALYFLRDLADAFASEVVLPAIEHRAKLRVAGGSLGGNLALLLGERVPALPWLERIIVWSPGSAWDANLEQAMGAGTARARAADDWSTPAKLRAFLETTFCADTVPKAGENLVRNNSYPQPWYWYWDCWKADRPGSACVKKGQGACTECAHAPTFVDEEGRPFGTTAAYPGMSRKKAETISRCFDDVRRSITPSRAKWHWEIAAEQVEFSHTTEVEIDGALKPRCAFLQVPAVFTAGSEDKYWPAPLHDRTRALYDVANDWGAPVTWAPIPKAGHSIHNEKPKTLARLLARA